MKPVSDDETIVLYDPPAGYKYGFPKEYDPTKGNTLEEILIADGYPADMAKEFSNQVRFIAIPRHLDPYIDWEDEDQ